jgi:hypothetical protein
MNDQLAGIDRPEEAVLARLRKVADGQAEAAVPVQGLAGVLRRSRRRHRTRLAGVSVATVLSTTIGVGAISAAQGREWPGRVIDAAGRATGIIAGEPACDQVRTVGPEDAGALRYLLMGSDTSPTVDIVQWRPCAHPLAPSTPTPYSGRSADPVRSWVRLGALGEVKRSLTLWRGLPPGISQDVADRVSTRRPTDVGDPGTVLDPPFREIEVRGVTGTLAGVEADTLLWTEPGGDRWALTSRGIGAAELAAIAADLRLDGEPRLSSATARDLDPLEVPDRRPTIDDTVTEFSACYYPGADGNCGVQLVVRPVDIELPWQSRPRGGISQIRQIPALLDGALPDRLTSVTWQPADGVEAELRFSDETDLQNALYLAAGVGPAAADDPRLRDADRTN